MAKAKLKTVEVSLELPFLGKILSGTWEADETEQRGAWELYVELVTRVAVVPLGDDEGLIREAFSSFHSLFATTREVLRRSGPDVARPSRKGSLTLAVIAVEVLNHGVRPLLAKWHPLLLDHEHGRPQGTTPSAHERSWQHGAEVRTELARVQKALAQYAALLAETAGIQAI